MLVFAAMVRRHFFKFPWGGWESVKIEFVTDKLLHTLQTPSQSTSHQKGYRFWRHVLGLRVLFVLFPWHGQHHSSTVCSLGHLLILGWYYSWLLSGCPNPITAQDKDRAPMWFKHCRNKMWMNGFLHEKSRQKYTVMGWLFKNQDLDRLLGACKRKQWGQG